MLNTMIGQVVQSEITFNESQDAEDITYPPGAIKVRLHDSLQTLPVENIAIPLNPNNINIPVVGEQVLIIEAPRGDAQSINVNRYYYLSSINLHGNINNNIYPILQRVAPVNRTTDRQPKLTREPEQASFESKSVRPLQPYQGDIIHQDRFGSAIRFSGTHTNTTPYQNSPIWESANNNSPILTITTGLQNSDSYYINESPDRDSSFIYLTSNQQFPNLSLSNSVLGSNVQSLDQYSSSQIIISSDRLIFNSKLDEIVLSSKKDVKILTPNWSADMNDMFSIMRRFIQAVRDLASGNATLATGVGPTGVASNLSDFESILSDIEKMQK